MLRKMLIPSEALKAGREAEKTKEGPLIHYNKSDMRNLGSLNINFTIQTWYSMTFREPAQKPPDEQRPIAIDPRSMSTLEAFFYFFNLRLECFGF